MSLAQTVAHIDSLAMPSNYSIPIFPYQIEWPTALSGSSYFAGLWTHLAIRLNVMVPSYQSSPLRAEQQFAVLMLDLPVTIVPNRYLQFTEPDFLPEGDYPYEWAETWGMPHFRSQRGQFLEKPIRVAVFDADQGVEIAFSLHNPVAVRDDSGRMPILLGRDFFENIEGSHPEVRLGSRGLEPDPWQMYQGIIEHHHRLINPSKSWGSFHFKAGI